MQTLQPGKLEYTLRLTALLKRRQEDKMRLKNMGERYLEEKCATVKKEDAIDREIRSVSWPHCSSFNGRLMFTRSSITYGRRMGGIHSCRCVCLWVDEVWHEIAGQSRVEVRKGIYKCWRTGELKEELLSGELQSFRPVLHFNSIQLKHLNNLSFPVTVCIKCKDLEHLILTTHWTALCQLNQPNT